MICKARTENVKNKSLFTFGEQIFLRFARTDVTSRHGLYDYLFETDAVKTTNPSFGLFEIPELDLQGRSIYTHPESSRQIEVSIVSKSVLGTRKILHKFHAAP